MKKILVLTLVLVVVLTGCSGRKIESKDGSKYVEYFYDSIEKASPGYMENFNEATKVLKIENEIKDNQALIGESITKSLEVMEDEETEKIYEQYKTEVDNKVSTLDLNNLIETFKNVIVESETDFDKAKNDLVVGNAIIIMEVVNAFNSVIPSN